jgi:L-fucose isomerase-like protein
VNRIGVVHPYWDFWASAVQGDFAADRRELAGIAEQTLAGSAELAWTLTVQPGDDVAALAAHLDAAIDAIVVVSTMAASPGTLLDLLAGFPEVPVVLWAAHLGRAVDRDLTHEGITLRGGTVGLPMIGAAFTRAGRPYDVVVGELREAGGIGGAVRRACAAGSVRGARLGVIGVTIPGYEWARVADSDLDRLGVEVVADTPAGFAARVAAAQPDPALAEGFDVDAAVDDRALSTALRYTAALQSWVKQERLAAGSINCHVAELRLQSGFGAAPCFALGRSTSAGVPWTCTGDTATALAMLLVTSLGAPTLYHEIEALDEVSGEAILANSGEHDSRFASVTPKRIIRNPWFPDDPSTASALFSLAPGPASLVAVASTPAGLTVLVAEGRFTQRTAPDSGTVNAAFEFASGPIGDAWQRWSLAGAGHHSCATDRHLAADLEVVCRHLGLGFVAV